MNWIADVRGTSNQVFAAANRSVVMRFIARSVAIPETIVLSSQTTLLLDPGQVTLVGAASSDKTTLLVVTVEK